MFVFVLVCGIQFENRKIFMAGADDATSPQALSVPTGVASESRPLEPSLTGGKISWSKSTEELK